MTTLTETLDLAPTLDLIDALVRRHDVSVIILRKTSVRETDNLIIIRRFEGDYHTAMGMACDMIGRISAALGDVREPTEDDAE